MFPWPYLTFWDPQRDQTIWWWSWILRTTGLVAGVTTRNPFSVSFPFSFPPSLFLLLLILLLFLHVSLCPSLLPPTYTMLSLTSWPLQLLFPSPETQFPQELLQLAAQALCLLRNPSNSRTLWVRYFLHHVPIASQPGMLTLIIAVIIPVCLSLSPLGSEFLANSGCVWYVFESSVSNSVLGIFDVHKMSVERINESRTHVSNKYRNFSLTPHKSFTSLVIGNTRWGYAIWVA